MFFEPDHSTGRVPSPKLHHLLGLVTPSPRVSIKTVCQHGHCFKGITTDKLTKVALSLPS